MAGTQNDANSGAAVQVSPEVAALGYEEARDRLIATVRQLEAGDVPLEQAISLWERGEELAAHCQSWLDNASSKLEAAVARGQEGQAGQGES
ncbi:exodeoxyribonuclease VII small subunit [Dermabacteraceae bacterium CCM 9519]